IRALEAGNGSRKDAAARLGISPRTLRYKIARLRDAGLDVASRTGMRTSW
ncbi:MAG: helix-turn-helix domain-containing protein, partial [Gammaproteobacteria bacterium]